MIEKRQIGYPKRGNQNTKEMMKTMVNSHNKNGMKASGPHLNDTEETKNWSKVHKVNEPYHKNKNRPNKKINKSSATPEEEKQNPKANFR